MSRPEFEDLVAEALDLIPAEFTRAMDNVVILVEDRHPTQNLYGLYHGVALTSRTSNYSGHLPDTITIYRCRSWPTPSDVEAAREQVATTVIHEVAHHFGIDDDRLDELGWALTRPTGGLRRPAGPLGSRLEAARSGALPEEPHHAHHRRRR